LATFNRETVQLIHDPLGVERITEKGVMVGGVEFEVDCIVMATGFDAPAASSDINAQQMGPARLGYDVIGRGGQRLSDKWGAPDPRHGDAEWNVSGAKTFESYHSAGFPNLCMQNAPQGVFTINFCYQLDEASKHFAHIISETLRRGKKVFDVRPEAEAEYLAQMWKRSPPAMARKPGCTPGYYNNEGKVGRPGTRKLAGQWPGLPKSFFDHCAKKRADNTALDVMTLE
jgi:cyclohexanone monooxygenase